MRCPFCGHADADVRPHPEFPDVGAHDGCVDDYLRDLAESEREIRDAVERGE